MATVSKNFRVKNGLVVEGSTATVNGYDVLKKSTSDENYIVQLVGGTGTSANTADTLVKRDGSGNFSAGVITADLTGDVTGTVSSLSNHDTDDLSEGTNQYFTDARAKTSAADLLTGATLTNISITGNGSGLTITAENGVADSDTDDLAEGTTNLYFTNTRARNAISGGTGITYDSTTGSISVTSNTYDTYGSASSAEGAANTYTDNAINALDTDDIEEGASNLYFTNTRARDAVSAGSGLNYNSGTGEFSVDTTTIASQTYVDNAITNLVDGAPGLLDTLNELAAAINDDENFFTTVANGLNGKQNTLTAGSNISIVSDTISVTGLDTDDVSEGSNLYFTDARARGAVDGTDRSFTSVAINDVAKQIAATTGNIATAAATTAYAWLKADYRSAKLTIKAKNGSHTHVSEVIVTLDTSDNIAINEYAITTSNGSLMDITADINSNDVRIRVTPANNNTEVMVVGTLIK